MMDAMGQKASIEFLEKALADVRSGKATGFVGIVMSAGGNNMITKSGGPKDTMYTMLSMIRHSMMDEMSAALRGQQPRSSLVRALPGLPGLNGQ